MQKKFTTQPLSHREQQLYLTLESGGVNVFKVADLKKLKLPFSYDHVRVLVQRLKGKGWLTPLGKGVYLRLPASAGLKGKVYLEDPFKVALTLFDGYLAFQSALKVHGLSEYEPFTVYVATKNKSETVEVLEQYEVKAITFRNRYTGYAKKNSYVVSTIAKTFFDCLFHPQYAGGYPEILKSLHACENMDWKEFLKYLRRFASDSLCQKIGYLLSLLSKTKHKVPAKVLNYLKSRTKVGAKTRLDPKRPAVNLVLEWQVYDNLGERKLLSWWLHG
jgi:predicted transcriptional regulator of viral defense system